MAYLLIANSYPSKTALYRNGFLHRRVKGYQERGIETEVFYFHPPVSKTYNYEYDSVNVQVGNDSHLKRRIESQQFEGFLVHFAQLKMIKPILDSLENPQITVWIHGFESESWHRRWFNFIESPEKIKDALDQDAAYHKPQLQFLHELFKSDDLDLAVINVSEWFYQNVVVPDVGIEPEKHYIIPNFIDTNFYPYQPKPQQMRKRILSIRPFASNKYANDISVQAILELSKRPYFDDLSFTLVGEGILMDELVRPLKAFRNVKIIKKFLTQDEISAMHKEYGVFLCPTRFDSQGVSMCEAMSSGLVPISSNVAAIPEFVNDGESGLLADAEDPVSLANAIERIYFNKQLFSSLSTTAAASIRETCGIDSTIDAEISVITRGRRHESV